MCAYIQQAVKIAEKFAKILRNLTALFLVSRLFIDDMTEILFRGG